MSAADVSLLPLGTSIFESLRGMNQIYVDKTDLIYQIARRRGKIFLARPRRFGKSLLVSTFETLFQNGLRDFKGLAIEKLWTDKTYSVAHLDFSNFRSIQNIEEFHERLRSSILSSFVPLGFKYDPSLDGILFLDQLKIWLKSLEPNSLVLLIDESDAPLTNLMGNQSLFELARDVLSDFFATLKQCDGCIRFFFMTGITKLSNTGIFSGFNAFTDISLDAEYGALLGWTQEEIRTDFGAYIENAAQILGMPVSEVLQQLQENYDGYSFDAEISTHVYCPWSVLKFLDSPRKRFQNYWYLSGGQPSALMKYLVSHELADPASYAEDKWTTLEDLEASREYDDIDQNVLLTQAGYLTIKSVDSDRSVKLGYPNQEVAGSMAQLYAERLLASKRLRRPGQPAIADILRDGDAEAVFSAFNAAVQAIDYQNYPIADEASCRAYIQVLLIGAAMIPAVEVHSALGRSDMEVAVGGRHWVFEFKYARTQTQVPGLLQEALRQMRSRRYGLSAGAKELHRVALVFCAEERRFAAFEELEADEASMP